MLSPFNGTTKLTSPNNTKNYKETLQKQIVKYDIQKRLQAIYKIVTSRN